MGFISDMEKEELSIRRMIFHVVGKELGDPILLDEIDPPQHTDFFLERVKSALKGNLFEFRERSGTETALRTMTQDPSSFEEQSKILASNFQSGHSRATSMGVFFVFELQTTGEAVIYALIKYDNEDVVRYILEEIEGRHVPRLERFRETFVRRPDAMQKIALIRLNDKHGGKLAVKDRSNIPHISEYFEGFLYARRVHEPAQMSGKLVEALKQTLKMHRQELPEDIQRSGVNRIYDVLRQGGHRFDAEDHETLVTAIFGSVDESAPIRRTFERQLKAQGIEEESFEILPEHVPKPKRKRMVTAEGTQIFYDEDNRPEVKNRDDGRREIVIITAKIVGDDIDTTKGARND